MGSRWSKLAGGLLALAVLAGCAGGSGSTQSASSVQPPAFGDTDPADWRGRGPGALPVHGIDVSKYQGPINWPQARANGVNFAFIKATEGGDRLDSGFAGHWRGAAAAGVARGAYHF